MDRDFTVGFSTSSGLTSRGLRWLMNSKISHVYGSWKVLEGVRLVVGMESHGLDWRPLRKFERTNDLKLVFKPIRGRLADPEDLERELSWFAAENANKEYAFSVIGVLFVFSVLEKLGRIGLWIRGKLHGFLSWLSLKCFGDDKEVCCSAYIELLQHAGCECVAKLKSHENDTQELLEALQASDDWLLIYDADATPVRR